MHGQNHIKIGSAAVVCFNALTIFLILVKLDISTLYQEFSRVLDWRYVAHHCCQQA